MSRLGRLARNTPQRRIALAKFSAGTLAMMQQRSTIAESDRQLNFYSARKATIG